MTLPAPRLALAALAALTACRSAPAEGAGGPPMTWRSFTLPVTELSGLAYAAGPDGPRLYAVGDEEAVLVTAPWGDTDGPGAPARIPLPLPTADGGSRLEAVAVDGAGVIYVLDEERARVHVLTLAAGRATLRHTFALTVPKGHALHKSWKKKPNKRGEGLVVLPGGHLLVAKQAHPMALIEFGPAGAAPEGVGDDREPPRPPLPSGAESELVPLAVWSPDAATADTTSSLNELTRAPGGGLYAASSKPDAAFVRIALPLPAAGGSFATTGRYGIPNAPGKAEALVIPPRREPAVVGFDVKGGVNLMVSTPLP